ncbi:hypothetical protein SP15_024 [Bacillus phage SP-15]|uniref:Hint domain-containing protein n=1 Tax=Bacillus phage SP-15 TaxID=1792032 RepID=A0A127AW79_9CAUD|nr:hypothetical protein SP15_024 [Bacillus phage SP-15]AMM44823.1 hypothetical protein SP15_024 [Bacillus phage SP-15]
MQSYGVAYRKLQGFLKDSPWFLRNGTVRGLKNKVYKPNKGIEFVVGSSPSHGLGRDIFCLTGESKIYTPEGVKTLSQVEGQEVCVLSFNPATEKFEWSDPALVAATGVRNDVYEIGFEDESFMRCTGDHKVMVRVSSGTTEYKEAKSLIPGDDVISLN